MGYFMKKGKVSENIIKRSVIKTINTNIKESAVCRSDCAIFTGYIADEMTEQCGAHAILRAVNNAYVSGYRPTQISLSVTLPESFREIKLKKIIEGATLEAKKHEAIVVDGHTETLDTISCPIITATAIAKKTDWVEGRPSPGDSIVMTKWGAMSGGARLANKYKKELLERYPKFIIEDAYELEKFYSVYEEAAVAEMSDAICMNDCSDGGVFAALWQLADKNGVGLKVNLHDIPIRQETVEICEFFDINPYKLRSDGSILIVTNNPQCLVDNLHEKNIPACIIGEITEGIDRVIVSGEDCRFLEEPRQDEGVML